MSKSGHTQSHFRPCVSHRTCFMPLPPIPSVLACSQHRVQHYNNHNFRAEAEEHNRNKAHAILVPYNSTHLAPSALL